MKFADDTTVIGPIRDDNDLAYREAVEQLVGWFRDNNLILNVDKTKEIIVDPGTLNFPGNQQHSCGGGQLNQVPGRVQHRRSQLVYEHCVTGIESICTSCAG